jgi:AcrR family transcriptional regulator
MPRSCGSPFVDKTKGERTRAAVVRDAAALFSRRGYGATMQELTAATGLKRGGIYNHFESKEQLAAESFAYATSRIEERLLGIARANAPSHERLCRIAEAFAAHHLDAARASDGACLSNGCVVLNTAVEAKKHMPVLRNMAQEAMRFFLNLVAEAFRSGQAAGELSSEADPEAVATIFIATLEGALALSVLYDEPAHLHRALDQVCRYVEVFRAA